MIARMRPSLSHDCCFGGGSLVGLSGASLMLFLGAALAPFFVVFMLALAVTSRGFFGFFWGFFSGSTGSNRTSWDVGANRTSGGLLAVVEGEGSLVSCSTGTWDLGGLLGVVRGEGSLLAEDTEVGVARDELLLE